MRFTPKLPEQFTTKDSKNSAKAMFMKNMQKGAKKAGDINAEERYNELYKEKLAELRNDALKGAKYTFNLPGTDPAQCKELSKGAQEIIQKIAEKKAKQAEKRAKKASTVSINAKYFTGHQGGRIDGKGKIYDSAGQCILEVDKVSGKIKNTRTGNIVGNYNANSTYSEHRICELIAKHSTTNNNGWYAGAAGHGAQQPSGGVWGKSTESCGNGNIWGSSGNNSGGNIWGNSSDDNNNNWW